MNFVPLDKIKTGGTYLLVINKVGGHRLESIIKVTYRNPPTKAFMIEYTVLESLSAVYAYGPGEVDYADCVDRYGKLPGWSIRNLI